MRASLFACVLLVACGSAAPRADTVAAPEPEPPPTPLGVDVPLHAAEHYYIVTRPMEGVLRNQPVLRDMDGYIYIKEEVGGLVLGGFEPYAKPWGMEGIPDGFEFQALPEDWDQFEVFMNQSIGIKGGVPHHASLDIICYAAGAPRLVAI